MNDSHLRCENVQRGRKARICLLEEQEVMHCEFGEETSTNSMFHKMAKKLSNMNKTDQMPIVAE